jgi:hypothetical protein
MLRSAEWHFPYRRLGTTYGSRIKVYKMSDSLENTGTHEIKELEKTAILNVALILRKVLTLNYKTLNMRKKINNK